MYQLFYGFFSIENIFDYAIDITCHFLWFKITINEPKRFPILVGFSPFFSSQTRTYLQRIH